MAISPRILVLLYFIIGIQCANLIFYNSIVKYSFWRYDYYLAIFFHLIICSTCFSLFRSPSMRQLEPEALGPPLLPSVMLVLQCLRTYTAPRAYIPNQLQLRRQYITHYPQLLNSISKPTHRLTFIPHETMDMHENHSNANSKPWPYWLSGPSRGYIRCSCNFHIYNYRYFSVLNV